MHLLEQALAQRQTAGQTVVHGRAVVEHLLDVDAVGVARRRRGEDIGQRRLRALDPRTVQGLLKRVRSEQQLGVRQDPSGTAEATEGQVGRGLESDGRWCERQLSGQRSWMEREVAVCPGRSTDVAPLVGGEVRWVHSSRGTSKSRFAWDLLLGCQPGLCPFSPDTSQPRFACAWRGRPQPASPRHPRQVGRIRATWPTDPRPTARTARCRRAHRRYADRSAAGRPG